MNKPPPVPPEDAPIPNLSVGGERAHKEKPKAQIVGPEVVELSIWGQIVRFFMAPKNPKTGQPLPELPRVDPEDPMTWSDEREEMEIEARQRGVGHNWERVQDRDQRFRSRYDLLD